MVANAALLLGLSESIKSRMPQITAIMPFELAHKNFYRAAKHGLNATLWWPNESLTRCEEQPLTDILALHLPSARKGLESTGISSAELDRYFNVIEERLDKRTSGAVWQQQMLKKLEETHTRHDALHVMLEQFIVHSQSNIPVAQWPISA